MNDARLDTWQIVYKHTAMSYWLATSGHWTGKSTFDRNRHHVLATAYANRLTGLNLPA